MVLHQGSLPSEVVAALPVVVLFAKVVVLLPWEVEGVGA